MAVDVFEKTVILFLSLEHYDRKRDISMQRPIKWEVPNGSITKNGISLPASLYFWGLNLRIRTCYKWLIKCTNNLNILFDTFREFLSFIRVCVFSVNIFKVTQVTLLLQGGQVLKKRLNHLWVFCEKGVLKSFKKYTGNDLCRSLFLIKVQGFSLQLYQKTLRLGASLWSFQNLKKRLFSKHKRKTASVR